MRNKPSLWASWLKYLIRRDRISKIAILLAGAFVALAFTVLKDTVDPLLALAALAGAFAFSFLSYICVGLPRMATEKKLYDSVDSDCKLPSKYNGRAMNRVKVDWGFLVAKKVTIHAEIASSATTSSSTWRSVKNAVSDAFNGGRQSYITVFDEHDRGTLTFLLPGTLKNPALEEKYRKIEDLTSFVYDSLHKYGNSLPRIKDLNGFDEGEDVPHSFMISLPYQAERYARQSFERDFKQKYENQNRIWMFKWSGLGVEVSHIERGTPEERKLYVVKSISDLITSSYTTSFHYSDKDYVFTEEMIGWDAEDKPERISIDFMHADISRPDKQERFEQLITQGLHQILKTPYWDFKWSVSLYEKILTVQRIDAYSEPVNTPAIEGAYEAPVEAVETVSDNRLTQTPTPVVRPAPAIPRPASRPSPPARQMPVRPERTL